MKSMGFKLLLAAAAVSLISLPPAGKAQQGSAQTARPNIVIIMTDDQNVDSLPVMRNLMAYPESSWVKFDNAFVNDSICCPARATVLTGQYAHTTGVINNDTGDQLDDTNTLPGWLDQAGYRTGLIGRYLNGFPWNRGSGYIPPGWDYFIQSGSGNADSKSNLAVDFINTSTVPFFLYVAYNEPHNPATPLTRYANAEVYIPPDPPNYNEADVLDKPRWIRNIAPLSQSTMDTWHAERVASQRALLGVDDSIQRIVDALKAKGALDNTMIIFLADHGFSWGSHRWIKKDCAYEECIRIPLLIRYPGSGVNREENRMVSNVDLASTIAEYAGVTPGLTQDGRSFLSVLNNSATDWQEEVLIETHNATNRTFYGIRVPGWNYAEYANGDKELYDLTNDPYEMQNQVNNPAYQAMRDQLAGRLQVLLNPGIPPTATPSPTPTFTSTPSETPTDGPSPTPTDTPTPSITPTPTRTATPSQTFTSTSSPTAGADLIFKDDFETGNLSAWSSSTTDGGDLSVSVDALTNNHRLQAVIDDNNSIYVTDDSPNAETRYRARFYFDPNSIAMTNGDTHYIFYGYHGASAVVTRIQLRRSAGVYQIRAALRDDGSGWTNSSWFTISDAPHSIEMDWRAATASGANNGGLTLWIDGAQLADLTGVDNDTRRIDRVRLGAVTGIDIGTRGTYYIDAFESRRQTNIGP